MTINSKTYMKSKEFKERQSSFGFFCAAAVEFLIEFRKECRKGWWKLFKGTTEKFKNTTLPLPFEMASKQWQELQDLANIHKFRG